MDHERGTTNSKRASQRKGHSGVRGLLLMALLSGGCGEWEEDWELPDFFNVPLFFDEPEGFGFRLEEPQDDQEHYVAVGVSRKRTSCAITSEGRVECWGRQGEAVPDERFVQIDGGDGFMCGVTLQGVIRCWVTSPGTLGEDVVVQAPAGDGFVQVTAGFGHVCGFREGTGEVHCVAAVPGEMDAVVEGVPSDRFRSFSSGNFDACGVREDGSLYCWGPELGAEGKDQPPAGAFDRVFVGDGTACALRRGIVDPAGEAWENTDEVLCWGQQGASLPSPHWWDVRKVSLGGDSACVLSGGLVLHCFGSDPLVNNTPSGCFLDVAVAEFHACAVSEHHEVVCWGDELYAGEDSSGPSTNVIQ